MDTSTIISIISLIVALLALPMSYWVAKRQVIVSLDEYERRSKQRARIFVADAIDEFFKVFYSAVREIINIEWFELQHRLKEIDQHIAQIDTFVDNTKVLDRLVLAIDSLSATGFADLTVDIVTRLLSIRNNIFLGSDATRSATLGVISACGGDVLQTALRKK